jgi:glutamyl-tRNA reductase
MRERLAFESSRIGEALSELVDHQVLDEGLIVSTCNRVEVVASSPGSSETGIERVTAFLCDYHHVQPDELEPHLYRRVGAEAVRHVFRVASSLDSMVVGESQILGQVKDAYQEAVDAGTVGRVLNQLMHRAISVAKRVRTETAIAQNPVSISSVAVELARKIFGELSGGTVLLVGAGEMAELAARKLIDNGTSRLIVTNRTAERAEEVARQFGGGAVNFEAFYDVLVSAHVVICSAGAPDYIIRASETQRALKNRRIGPVLFIDISVPRNIDPRVAELDNCFLFDIDDLETIVRSNVAEREREAKLAEAIIEHEVHQFVESIRELDIGPTVVEVKELISQLALAELKRNRKRLGALTSEQEAAIREVLIPALVNKLSHPVIVHLRNAARNGEPQDVLDQLRKMVRAD